jgi:sec-independent protein translocase protein TatA
MQMGSMSLFHWAIVLFVALLFFGPKRLGTLGKSLGQGIRNLREGIAADTEQDNLQKRDEPKHEKPPSP